ncbi:MAG TPA: ABC transporter ATP-binding protein, partial [Burkholderiales bacterium]|nr:ABC transporter ATP-binding protein [Burkholderiales bacterium]
MDRVSVRVAGVRLLSEVDLRVNAGEILALIGLNGAGKSSLLKAVLDLMPIETGSIRIFGRSHHDSAARNRISFLPERLTPMHYLQGREFLRYLLTLQNRAYIESQVHGMLDALELSREALGKPVRTLSKGMGQKLGLAACLLSDKDFYVLDEPSSGLDPVARGILRGQLDRLRGEGKTVLLTSHALPDVTSLCDRMAVLHHGRMVFTGSALQLQSEQGCATLEEAFLALMHSSPSRSCSPA